MSVDNGDGGGVNSVRLLSPQTNQQETVCHYKKETQRLGGLQWEQGEQASVMANKACLTKMMKTD